MPHKEEQSEFTPELYPDFPSDPQYPTVELQTISLKKLESNDEAEKDRAFEAFKTRGFVYLDLAGCQNGDTILSGSTDVARGAERTFSLPTEEKMKYQPTNKSLFGYAGMKIESLWREKG